ncbi:MAG TPA: FAD-dependent thymidylate synthase [Bryobacteraceae bacterium]|nr:FAD-dependent thymidylate synthase [Bryobacteraceae bacterium]
MPEWTKRQVIAVAPMPPEKSAYALARYSRSADSIVDSLAWVRTHDSSKFLESFYFQYGHASIADLGHIVLCFEGISELAAAEVEDEPLWDGQAKSSRYQDFGQLGFVTPPELTGAEAASYEAAGRLLLEAYREVHDASFGYLTAQLPRPEEMKPDAYQRNIAARAFDVARYLLFWGVPTNVGQVTSIRTLEKQIQRLKASPYAEMRAIGDEIAAACAREPACKWDLNHPVEPLAPTLAKYCAADQHLRESRDDLRVWAAQNLGSFGDLSSDAVDLLKPAETAADIVATLLYPVCDWSFRALYDWACGVSSAVRAEVIDTAVRSRGRRDDLLREFRGNLYCYDMVMDIGAYRDFHRHRRCQQYRQAYTGALGYDMPEVVSSAGVEDIYRKAMDTAIQSVRALPAPGSDYLLPFGARNRFLFKMDFAEAEYIARVRSGVKGHFSYRKIAWEMKCAMERLEPELARLLEATPPWIEDPLKR